ncbi:MAG: hypothetical protein ABSE95_17520, partial [Thermodesulfobacteriota bacterium]
KVLPASLEAFYIGRHPAPDWEPFQKLDDRFPTGNLFKARQNRADRAARPATRRPKPGTRPEGVGLSVVLDAKKFREKKCNPAIGGINGPFSATCQFIRNRAAES